MKRLVIVATRFRRDSEAQKVFEECGWRPIKDESTIPAKKKLINKNSRRTPLFDLEWEEYEYE